MIAPSTRPAPMAMKNARKPSQNESVRFPVITAATMTIAKVDRPFLFLNLLLLMTVSFLPFPTRLVAHYLQRPGEQTAVYAYAATFVSMSIIYNAGWRYASSGRRLIGENVP